MKMSRAHAELRITQAKMSITLNACDERSTAVAEMDKNMLN